MEYWIHFLFIPTWKHYFRLISRQLVMTGPWEVYRVSIKFGLGSSVAIQD
ncbi:hypothetical protein HanIR_Chr16g0820101 [Helianthus annuus]|nr:hypothetical protein HanIR_Chr16g0820101 [Helianthus annuus]